jgi:murein peptide amidase A
LENIPLASDNAMTRSGKNIDGYHGETIDIDGVLHDLGQVARDSGWQTDLLRAGSDWSLPALRRVPTAMEHRFYLSAGIHGDEPAGPLAMLQLIRDGLWPAQAGVWLCPCLNPRGFAQNRRENPAGLDLNRDYRSPQSDEIRAHVDWLRRQPLFDLTLCLHEDWEAKGFYVYELNPDQRPSHASAIIQAVAPHCPIDDSPLIENRAAKDGVIRPDLNPTDRPQWPEAFYLITHQTRQSYTLEAPSDFPLRTRVAALVAAARTAIAQAVGLAATCT